MTPHLAWYIARAGGIVAWLLLTASVMLGLLLSTRLATRWAGAAWLQDVHRFVSGLAIAFVGVHIAGLVADTYVHFGVADVLVPLASRWRPVAVAWGVVGMWLLVSVEITSLLRRRMPRRVWHAIHLTSYVTYVATTIHLLTAGTDAWTRPVAALTVVATGTLTVVAVTGVVRSGRRPARRAVPPYGLRPCPPSSSNAVSRPASPPSRSTVPTS